MVTSVVPALLTAGVFLSGVPRIASGKGYLLWKLEWMLSAPQ
jgi:hypothetical protein